MFKDELNNKAIINVVNLSILKFIMSLLLLFAKKPTAKVLKEAISATIAGISAGKNAFGKMIAAAVP